MRNAAFVALFVFLVTAPLRAPETTSRASVERQIREVLVRQEEAWNRGDIEGFMVGYELNGAIVFTSGGVIYRGWQSTLDHYREAYPDRKAMGILRFSDLEITLLGSTGAVVLGRWELQRTSDRPHGVFTLVFRKGSRGWKIVHDHTSTSR